MQDQAEHGTSPEDRGPPVRVLHLTSVETTNYYLNNLADFSAPQQVSFRAVTLGRDRGFVRPLEERGVFTRALACGGRVAYPRAVSALIQMIRDEQVDLLHGHLFEPALLSAVVSRLTRTPLVLTRHHSDAVHRIPGRLRRAAYLSLERFTNSSARQIIAPSQMVRSILTRDEGVPSSKVTVVPYPQDPCRYNGLGDAAVTRRHLGVGEGIALVCVSRLHPEKGHRFLFQAVRELLESGHDLHLYLLGVGPSREHLNELARDLRIETRVRFLGWREDALSVLAAADVVVHPSLHEALPSVVVEATMLERPVVATDVSGVRDILGNDEFGTIVPKADASSLTDAINAVLADSKEALSRARRGRRYLLQYMDASRVAEAHLECYQRALSRRSSPGATLF